MSAPEGHALKALLLQASAHVFSKRMTEVRDPTAHASARPSGDQEMVGHIRTDCDWVPSGPRVRMADMVAEMFSSDSKNVLSRQLAVQSTRHSRPTAAAA